MTQLQDAKIGGPFDEIELSSLKARDLDNRYQEASNHFLEAISDFIKIVDQKIQLMEVISSQLEKLTWIETNSNRETIQKVSAILHTCRGMLTGFKNDLKVMEVSKINKECPNSVTKFKNEVELLEENIEDTEMIFFELRNDPEFNDLDKQISEF